VGEHSLVWRDSRGGMSTGSTLLGWQHFTRSGNAPYFARQPGPPQQVNNFARIVTARAIALRLDVTFAWGGLDAHPMSVPAAELEAAWMQLTPRTLVCPARPKGDRWAVCAGEGKPALVAESAVQEELNSLVARLLPPWIHGISFTPHCLMVRHSLDAETLGFLAPEKKGPDDLLNEIADDPAVREAFLCSDASLPSTMQALAAARLDAEARRGIAPEQRVVLFSGEAEDMLLPTLLRIGRGEGPAALAHLRRQFWRTYGTLTDVVLLSALRNCSHQNAALVLEAATASTPAAAE
jgi:hypothetical protein